MIHPKSLIHSTILAVPLFVLLPSHWGLAEEIRGAGAEMKTGDYSRYDTRVPIHRPAVLPEGIIPAKKSIKFPRNEKIRIAEPRIMKIAEPAVPVVKKATPAVPLATKPVKTQVD